MNAPGLSISPEEHRQFQQHFINASPVNGKLTGSVARASLMQSGLPTHQLGQIWELADIDKDGALDFDEYCIALKLVFSILNHSIAGVPAALPQTLIPQSKYAYFGGMQTQAPAPLQSPSQVAVQQVGSVTLEWYVPSEDRARYQGIFAQYSRGASEVRLLDVDEFLGTLGIPRSIITQVWSIIDVRKYQQLNQEQFVYLLHVLNACLRGASAPATLPPVVKDNIYRSLNLESSTTVGSSQSHGYKYGKSSASGAGSTDPRKPGLYGEKSGNVALADSYLSKLKTSSTFKNEAGSRYASSSKNAEEEKKLQAELKELDEELRKLNEEAEDHKKRPQEDDLMETTLKELESLKEYKLQEKRLAEAQDSGTDDSSKTLQEIKQSIFSLEGHLAFLLSEKRSIDEFLDTGKQKLLELQVEQMKLK
ncbi:endocytosis defective- protein [Coemansia sp. RSA 2703]|nr:endocytosis defective- protein [Coemansia sp. RSA 2703]KAJ2376493.1 endocytosis defective- protein [Coemansia sp. RSA 2607]KAJ2387897.1 endocytosis defective- protein [Coemansia sp. RSA 2603]